MYRKSISSRLLSTFPISDQILTKLSSKGFNIKPEIEAVNISKLQLICGLTDEELDQINDKIIKSHEKEFKHEDVWKLFSSNKEWIKTGSNRMDYVLNGGIEVSRLTQICGEGGAGKTQICMQLCLNVQLPQQFGGLSGEALYIDTEDNIRPERLCSMADYCLKEYKNLSQILSIDKIQSRIHLRTCNKDAQELVEIITNQIEPFIEQNPRIRLVVIDSIAYHFRYDYKGEAKDYELAQIAHKLKQLAHSKKVAVLITNQVTYSPEDNCNVPSLGRHWQTVCSTSIMIERTFNGNPRRGTILKSTRIPEHQLFHFDVAENGIQDAME